MHKALGVCAILILAGIAPATLLKAEPRNPVSITFTEVPRCGAGANERANIAGKVTGLDHPEQSRVVIYAHTNAWWVQPLASDPLTRIDATGVWSNWTHLGERYAAVVVKSTATYVPASQTQTLPGIGGDVLAVSEVAAPTRCSP